MLLQLALDCESAERAIEVCDQCHDIIDIIEAGQVANTEGAKFVKVLKERYPKNPVVWDLKVNNLYTCVPAINYGADYVSLLQDSPVSEFVSGLKYAHERNCKVIGDMVFTKCDSEKMLMLEELGCDQISLYPNYVQDHAPILHDVLALQVAKLVLKKAEISVYGGLNLKNMAPVCDLKPDIIVVGQAIWNVEKPREAAIAIKEFMSKYN